MDWLAVVEKNREALGLLMLTAHDGAHAGTPQSPSMVSATL
jgi:hypothetical protein